VDTASSWSSPTPAARSTKATFQGSGGDQLAARVDLPAGQPVAFAVFAHCFTCSKNLAAASRIARRLIEHGLGVLRFDFTGLGSSEGEFANTNFSSNVEDLVRAAAWLRDSYQPPRLLVGHSLGGAAALAAASRLPEINAVATIGAPFDPSHLSRLFPPDVLDRLQRDGAADVRLAGRTFRVARDLLDDVRDVRLVDHIRDLQRALLVLHSPRDEVVDIDHARRIFEVARHPKSFVSLDDADHLLTKRHDADYVASVLAAWAGRYLPTNNALDTTSHRQPGRA
jgi:alpha/beta superfamily hydrolase